MTMPDNNKVPNSARGIPRIFIFHLFMQPVTGPSDPAGFVLSKQERSRLCAITSEAQYRELRDY